MSCSTWAKTLLSFSAFVGCRSEPSPEPSSPPHAVTAPRKLKLDPALWTSDRVTTVVAERRAPSEELKFPGEVRAPVDAAEVGALVSGRIAQVLAVEGARVERGQVLAWLDAPEVARATAEVLRATARASSAKNKLSRQLELESQLATSKSALDEARTEAQVARADLLAARTLLRSLGGVEPTSDGSEERGWLNARVALRAPAAGVVLRREAVLGSAVTPERTLFWLSGESIAVVVARVPEGAPVPKTGESARLETRGSGLQCRATVRGLPGGVASDTRSVEVPLTPDASCAGLIPGAYVDVTFARPLGPERAGLLVPREAIVDVHGASVAFVAENADGEVAVRPVRIAEQIGADLLIESGLRPGERVVNRGAVLLKGELLQAQLTGE